MKEGIKGKGAGEGRDYYRQISGSEMNSEKETPGERKRGELTNLLTREMTSVKSSEYRPDAMASRHSRAVIFEPEGETEGKE